jgi:hypothetical protein
MAGVVVFGGEGGRCVKFGSVRGLGKIGGHASPFLGVVPGSPPRSALLFALDQRQSHKMHSLRRKDWINANISRC